jgi:DNA-binding NarL/FixJ family response regulator
MIGVVRPDPPVTVVIIDDHESYAEAIGLALDRCPPISVLGHRVDLDAGMKLVAQTSPDVVLLDWRLSASAGIEALSRIQSAAPTVRTIILTGFVAPSLRQAAGAAGAYDVIDKSVSVAEIATAVVRTAAAATNPLSASTPAEDGPRLNQRQAQILWLLADGHDVAAIAQRLFLSPHTVRTYIKGTLRALEAHSRVEALAKARALGLLDA